MEIGQVIGATTLRGFRFVIKKGMEKYVKRDEFVTTKEAVTGNEILGIIISALLFGFIVSFREWGPGDSFELGYGLRNFMNATFISLHTVTSWYSFLTFNHY